jgi:hypothetical protein
MAGRISLPRCAAVAIFALGLPACGGEDIGRPAPPEAAKELDPVDWCEVAEGYEFLSVVDFEPNGTSTSVCDVASRDQMTRGLCSPWIGKDDGHNCMDAPATSLRPSGNTNPIGGDAVPGGRCGGPANGVHLVGTRVAACVGSDGKIGWGANFEIRLPANANQGGGTGCREAPAGGLRPGSKLFDATCWDGVSFWAKKSPGPVGTSITVTVPDYWTSDAEPEVALKPCSTADSAADSEKCDAPGVAISMREEWTLVVVPFSLLKQKGFGVPSPLKQIDPSGWEIDSGNVRGITFLLAPGDWDFWLDDVALYRTKVE